MGVNIEGKPLREIDLDNKHQRQALKKRLAEASAILPPVSAGGQRRDIKNLEHGFDAPPYELEELQDARSEFTPEEKINAVIAYLATGDTEIAEQFCNVKARTIRHWRQKAKWWPTAVKIARARMMEVLDLKFSEIINAATEQLLDRILNGDVVSQNGRRKRVPMKGRELAQVISTIFDKRAASRGDPTSITENRKETSTIDHLEDLRDKFASFDDEWKQQREEKVVSEQ